MHYNSFENKLPRGVAIAYTYTLFYQKYFYHSKSHKSKLFLTVFSFTIDLSLHTFFCTPPTLTLLFTMMYFVKIKVTNFRHKNSIPQHTYLYHFLPQTMNIGKKFDHDSSSGIEFQCSARYNLVNVDTYIRTYLWNDLQNIPIYVIYY